MTSVGGNRKFDITNSVSCRFHQVEIFCSFCIKFFIGRMKGWLLYYSLNFWDEQQYLKNFQIKNYEMSNKVFGIHFNCSRKFIIKLESTQLYIVQICIKSGELDRTFTAFSI